MGRSTCAVLAALLLVSTGSRPAAQGGGGQTVIFGYVEFRNVAFESKLGGDRVTEILKELFDGMQVTRAYMPGKYEGDTAKVAARRLFSIAERADDVVVAAVELASGDQVHVADRYRMRTGVLYVVPNAYPGTWRLATISRGGLGGRLYRIRSTPEYEDFVRLPSRAEKVEIGKALGPAAIGNAPVQFLGSIRFTQSANAAEAQQGQLSRNLVASPLDAPVEAEVLAELAKRARPPWIQAVKARLAEIK